MTKTLKKPFVLKGYTEKQRQQLLRLIADGITVTYAAKALGIKKDHINNWIRNDDRFAEQYKQARMQQVHSLGDEILEIADEPIETMEQVQHAKLRVEARKWLMSKWAPRMYGDKVHTDHTHTFGVVILPQLDTQQQVLQAVQQQVQAPGQLQLPPVSPVKVVPAPKET